MFESQICTLKLDIGLYLVPSKKFYSWQDKKASETELRQSWDIKSSNKALARTQTCLNYSQVKKMFKAIFLMYYSAFFN